MSKEKINIKTGMLFPMSFQFIAVIVIIIGMALIVNKTILSIILIVGGIFVLSGYSGLQIDRAIKVYREYYSFFILKGGMNIKFAGVERIFINSSNVKERMYTSHTGQSLTFSNREFNGYLKFDDGKNFIWDQIKKRKVVKEPAENFRISERPYRR